MRMKSLMVGLPLSLFFLCVPKKRNFSISFLSRSKNRAWKHIGTLEWKLKRNVAPVPSEMEDLWRKKKG